MKADEVGHSVEAWVAKYTDEQTAAVAATLGREPRAADFEAAGIRPAETVHIPPNNLFTTGGLGRLTSLLTGAGGVAFSGTTTTMVGVGDTATAATAADTQLGSNSAGHSYYVPADSTPTRVTTTVTNDSIQCIATFSTSSSDFAWAEWGLVLVTTAAASATFAGTGTSPLLFNHKIASVGTKSGGTWVFSAKVQFT
jgi:hypothetical protein